MIDNLIELLDKNAGEGSTPIRQAVTMLRQQQEKLTKYELRNEEQRNRIAHLEAEIEALKAENSHLKYEISSGAWNPAPLTDEELSKVYEELYINYAGKDFPVDLGRAILRKAQEK